MAGETAAHKRLKRAALFWAQQHGYPVCGLEVRVPKSNWRADAAAYQPLRGSVDNGSLVGTTAIFECKQSRPDFLSDSRSLQETRLKLEECQERRRHLEHLLGVHHPHLSKGESLFPEYESYDLDSLDHKNYRRLVKDIRMLQARLYEGTKFERMVNYRCANVFFLVINEGVMSEDEVPLDWGLLVLREGVEISELQLVRKPSYKTVDERVRLQLLERIALRGARTVSRGEGIDEAEVWERGRREI